MYGGENKNGPVNNQVQDGAGQTTDNRSAMIGLLALLSLAFPALLIRTLFPDLNPLFLAGLGVVTYGSYLTVLMLKQTEQVQEMESSLEFASTKAHDNRSISPVKDDQNE